MTEANDIATNHSICATQEEVQCLLETGKCTFVRPVEFKDSDFEEAPYTVTVQPQEHMGAFVDNFGWRGKSPFGDEGDVLAIKDAALPWPMFVRNTGVRVKRIKDLSTSDIVGMGFYASADTEIGRPSCCEVEAAFNKDWNKRYCDKEGLNRDDNPWVWVAEMEAVDE